MVGIFADVSTSGTHDHNGFLRTIHTVDGSDGHLGIAVSQRYFWSRYRHMTTIFSAGTPFAFKRYIRTRTAFASVSLLHDPVTDLSA